MIILFSLNAFSQISETKLVPSDGISSNTFGYSVAIAGDYVVIGAHGDDEHGIYTGAAYVYLRSGGSWTEQEKLKPRDTTDFAQFGFAVAIDGDHMIIGAPGDEENGTEAGAAYIFERDSITGNWTKRYKLLASDGESNDEFGWAVAIWGDYAIVGAPLENSYIGSAYVFKRSDTTWIEEDKLTASNGVGDAVFGVSVSIYGDYTIIGAYQDDEIGNEAGAAYIFRRDNTNWTQQEKLLASDIGWGDWFGKSVSIFGDYAIVGAIYAWGPEARAGSAYIFKREDTTWTEQVKLIDSTGANGHLYGSSVCIKGDYAAVGEPADNDNGPISGSAFIYKRVGENWIEMAKLLASDGETGDDFGRDVCINNDYTIVGAPFEDAGGTYSGAAYIYDGFLTGIKEQDGVKVPQNFTLKQNYPNPFNPNTIIRYQLPERGNVSLKVYDVLGNEVATLVNEENPAGEYELEFNAEELTSGIYFYQLKTDNYIKTKKMILLR